MTEAPMVSIPRLLLATQAGESMYKQSNVGEGSQDEGMSNHRVTGDRHTV